MKIEVVSNNLGSVSAVTRLRDQVMQCLKSCKMLVWQSFTPVGPRHKRMHDGGDKGTYRSQRCDLESDMLAGWLRLHSRCRS